MASSTARILLGVVLLGTGAYGWSAHQKPPDVIQHKLTFARKSYQYFLASPASFQKDHPMPLLLLVHGSGGDGLNFIQFWREFARDRGFIVLAPTLPLDAEFEKQVPDLFPAFVEDAKNYAPVDARRVFLFGYSAGGYAIFDAAMFDSTYFAAAAVFAGIITPDYDSIVSRAQRKIPVALYIGDHDQFFSLAQTRRTKDLLLANGIPVRYVELAGHDHNYAAVADWVNRDAWNFMNSTPTIKSP